MFGGGGFDASTFAVGDVVDILGTYIEYYDLSEIDAGSVTKVSSGAAPAAETLTLPIADPEPWEGVLVQFKNVSVQSSPSEDTYGEWELTDGTNTFWVDEKLYDASEDFMLGVGEEFASITGIMNYSYSKYKIAPRSKADLAK